MSHARETVSPAFCLKTGVQANQKGMIRGLLKYVLFCLDPINVLEEKQTEIHTKAYQRSFWHCTLELVLSWISTSSTDEAALRTRRTAAGDKGCEQVMWKLVSIDGWRIICVDTDAAHAAGAGTAQHRTIDRKALVNLSITLSASNQG